jgi:hypothetical protein
MSSVPASAIWSIIVPCVLLSPMLAFLLAIAVEILIGSLVEAGAPAFLAVVATGAGGLFLIRKLRPQAGASAET